MAQTKIYPSTQAQVQAVQNTVDEINSKIVTPSYQVKTITPSNVQQTVQADTGYTALSGVVVNPISALMPESLEDYILRTSAGAFTLSLSGEIPEYACYGQDNLVGVYGNANRILAHAFEKCTSLHLTEFQNVTSIRANAFSGCTSVSNFDFRSVETIGDGALSFCSSLLFIDLRKSSRLGGLVFSGDGALKLIDFTSVDSPPILDSFNAFQSTNNTWKAVVKDDTAKALFQAATNWSVKASQIYTVAEIEALVGMTYDEYYLQLFGHARNEVQA